MTGGTAVVELEEACCFARCLSAQGASFLFRVENGCLAGWTENGLGGASTNHAQLACHNKCVLGLASKQCMGTNMAQLY
jgi:hypothetical protein